MTFQQKISPTRPEDSERIVEVWEASVRATHHFVTEIDIEFFRPLVRAATHEGVELGCIRDEGGEVVGFVGTHGSKIEMLFIHPDWIGQGIGKLLIRYAVDVVGTTCVDVNEQNEGAVGFYRHMGFRVESRSKLDGTGKPLPLLHMKLERV